MVLFHHLIYDKYLHVPLAHLYNGFTIFFVLSGFLITFHNYKPVVQNQFSSRKYFLKRFARIYPVYLLFLIIHVLLRKDQNYDFSFWFMNLTLIKGWSAKYIYSGIGQAWTLTMEETFYAIAPLLFLFLRRVKIWMMMILSLLLGLAHYFLGRMYPNPHFFMDFYSITQTGFFFMFLPFAFGISAALVVVGQPSIWANILSRSKKITDLGFYGLIGSLIFIEYFKPFSAPFWHYSIYQSAATLFLVPLSTSLLFIGLCKENSFLKRFLSRPSMVLLGKASYVLYLIQLGPVATYLAKTINVSNGLFNIFIYILALNFLSIVIYKFFEESIAKQIRQFL